jgi:CheY-like chemotaxis protein
MLLRVLICSEHDLMGELSPTLAGRGDIGRFCAASLDDALLLARTTTPQVIFVDRDLPWSRQLIRELREGPATRHLSVAILARGDFDSAELELLDSGANAILRLPPSADWDQRLSRLFAVPVRQEARVPVRIVVDRIGGADETAEVINLSAKGMLLQTQLPLQPHQDLDFSFRLPDGQRVAGRGRVVRSAAPGEYGIDFLTVDDASREAIRQFVRSFSVG